MTGKSDNWMKTDEIQEFAASSYKRCRFEALPDEAVNAWDLPSEMEKYANKHMIKFINDKVITDTVLVDQPVPSNLVKPLKMDEFFKDMLEERKMKSQLAWDQILEKLQHKTVNVYGPLSKVWLTLEDALASDVQQPVIDLEELAKLVEQTILLLGQSFNAVTYHRRLSALTGIMADNKKAKSTLKDQAKLLEEGEDSLFGKQFRKQIIETAKTRKESKDVYQPRRSSVNKRPFRASPSFRKENGGRTATFTRISSAYRGGYSNNRGGYYNNRGGYYNNRGFNGKKELQQNGSLLHSLHFKNRAITSKYYSVDSIRTCPPICQKPVSRSSHKQLPTSRKTAVFCKKLENFDKQSRNFGVGNRLKNTIFGGTSAKHSSTSSKYEPESNCFNKPGTGGNVEEGGHHIKQI